MSTNKHAIIRYMTLDKCLRNFGRRYYIEDLIKACQEALYDYTGRAEGVQRRQILNDLNDMEDSLLFDVTIDHIRDGRRVYYRYHDPNKSIRSSKFSDEDLNKMKEALLMLRRLKGLPSYNWVEEFLIHIEQTNSTHLPDESVIEFESNPYVEGLDHLEKLLNAAINHQPQHIVYKGFEGPKKDWNIHPYYLKRYNNRWYLFGYNEKFQNISCLPLDRILSTEDVGIPFIPNSEIDFKEEYFSDIIGVTITKNDITIQKVVLQFDSKRFPYITSKPIHESQSIIDKEKRIIQIKVIPNKELEALLLSYGNQVTVLEPESLRNQIKDKIKSMIAAYEPVHIECTDK